MSLVRRKKYVVENVKMVRRKSIIFVRFVHEPLFCYQLHISEMFTTILEACSVNKQVKSLILLNDINNRKVECESSKGHY